MTAMSPRDDGDVVMGWLYFCVVPLAILESFRLRIDVIHPITLRESRKVGPTWRTLDLVGHLRTPRDTFGQTRHLPTPRKVADFEGFGNLALSLHVFSCSPSHRSPLCVRCETTAFASRRFCNLLEFDGFCRAVLFALDIYFVLNTFYMGKRVVVPLGVPRRKRNP